MGFARLATMLKQDMIGIRSALGLIPGIKSLDKFGRATGVSASVYTDIWDRANDTHDQFVWLPPTQARIHNIVSTSTTDTLAGVGAQKILVFGLTSWDAKEEISETIEMDGDQVVATQNAYVIIYRMRITQSGATTINAGFITATAVVDGTVTAQINIGEGQTQMAIFGIPSSKTLVINSKYSSVLRTGLATQEVHADAKVSLNSAPDSQLLNYLIKHSWGLGTRANSPEQHSFFPPRAYKGPLILKISAVSSVGDTDISAGFDGYIIDNATFDL